MTTHMPTDWLPSLLYPTTDCPDYLASTSWPWPALWWRARTTPAPCAFPAAPCPVSRQAVRPVLLPVAVPCRNVSPRTDHTRPLTCHAVHPPRCQERRSRPAVPSLFMSHCTRDTDTRAVAPLRARSVAPTHRRPQSATAGGYRGRQYLAGRARRGTRSHPGRTIATSASWARSNHPSGEPRRPSTATVPTGGSRLWPNRGPSVLAVVGLTATLICQSLGSAYEGLRRPVRMRHLHVAADAGEHIPDRALGHHPLRTLLDTFDALFAPLARRVVALPIIGTHRQRLTAATQHSQAAHYEPLPYSTGQIGPLACPIVPASFSYGVTR